MENMNNNKNKTMEEKRQEKCLYIVRNLTSIHDLKHLSIKERKYLAIHSIDANILRILTRDKSFPIKLIALSNKHTPLDTLCLFYDKDNFRIRKALLANENLPDDIRIRIIKRDPRLKKEFLKERKRKI